MILDGEQEALLQVAREMALAARTAPKGCGIDNLAIAILDRADLKRLADEMEQIAERRDAQAFRRDAGNIRQAPVALLIGTRLKRLGLKVCGLCGYTDCAANEQAGSLCAFNTGDLGIAVGSAAAVAARHHADCRVMYTLGLAAVALKSLGSDIRVAYGIPLSATGKNPFFDRK